MTRAEAIKFGGAYLIMICVTSALAFWMFLG